MTRAHLKSLALWLEDRGGRLASSSSQRSSSMSARPRRVWGNVLIGPPDYVAERISELREVGEVNYVLGDMALPYMSQRQILGSLELFATKVMPQLAASS